MREFVDCVREAATKEVWSRGVELSRGAGIKPGV